MEKKITEKERVLAEMSKLLDFTELGPSSQGYFRACFEVALLVLDMDASSVVRRTERIYSDLLDDFFSFFDGAIPNYG